MYPSVIPPHLLPQQSPRQQSSPRSSVDYQQQLSAADVQQQSTAADKQQLCKAGSAAQTNIRGGNHANGIDNCNTSMQQTEKQQNGEAAGVETCAGVQGGQQAENKPQPSSLKDAVKANGNDSDIFDALFSKWGEDLDLAEAEQMSSFDALIWDIPSTGSGKEDGQVCDKEANL
eukprot:jgi/Chrzof1/4964/Cz15g06160.t1